MGRLLKDISSGSLDQITAKAYLDKNVFGYLEKSLNDLLETIETNGEFEKYVGMLADRQEREQRELRRRAREQKRIELGDTYISSESEGSKNSDEDESGDEDSYEDEVLSNPAGRTISDFRQTGTSMPKNVEITDENTMEMGEHLKTMDGQSQGVSS